MKKGKDVKIIGWIITLAIIVMGVAFSALNAQSVSVNYLFGKSELPLAVILLLAFGLGVLLSILILGPKIVSLATKNKWISNKLKKAEDHMSHMEVK